jgi:predicted ATPase
MEFQRVSVFATVLQSGSPSGFDFCAGDPRQRGLNNTPPLLTLYVPRRSDVVYTAAVVVVSGPAGDSAAVYQALLNRPVLAGTQFLCGGAVYTIVSVEQTNGFKGLALVVPATRVKVNVRRGDVCAAKPPMLFGVDRQRSLLHAFLAERRRSGVLLVGPHGCGVTSLLREVAAGLGLAVSRTAQEVAGAGILLLDDLDDWAAVDEAALLAHRASVLDRLRRAKPAGALRLAGVSRAGSVAPVLANLFTVTIRVDAPDAAVRAQIIGHVRNCSAESCVAEAAEMVGMSASAVVRRAALAAPPPPPRRDAWAQLGGLAEAKRQLRLDLVLPRRCPGVFRRFGLTPPRGVLLHGPPGCGKTSIVKALCSEGLMTFIYLDSASVMSAYVGETEKAIRDAFATARAKAPSLIFFDEVDVIGRSRALSDDSQGSTRLLSTLLTEMDGFDESDNVCFVGATNLPHLLDAALTRPGRFDRVVTVPLPSLAERQEIAAVVLGDQRAVLHVGAAAIETAEGQSSADVVAACRELLLSSLV